MNGQYINRCQNCKGIGLILHPKNKCCEQRCYLCENSFKNGLYSECNECLGSGSCIDKTTKINIKENNKISNNINGDT